MNRFRLAIFLASTLFLFGCKPEKPIDDSSLPLPMGREDALLIEVEEKLPGFGGLYFDETGSIVVYLLDVKPEPEKSGQSEDEQYDLVARVELAIEEVYGKAIFDIGCEHDSGLFNPARKSIKLKQGQYTIRELYGYRNTTKELLSSTNIVLLDVDEFQNRLVLGVDRDADDSALKRQLTEIGVPLGAVQVEIVKDVEPFQLGVRVDPLQGGALIQKESDTAAMCALGFNAYVRNPDSNGEEWKGGFVTNSHCTGKFGSVESTSYVHGNPPIDVGEEIKDPKLVNCQFSPFVYLPCRNSDAAFIEFFDSAPWELGKIVRTAGMNNGVKIIATDDNPYFLIVGKGSHLIKGQVLDKVGPTTGWTSGEVKKTCFDVWNKEDKRFLMCQGQVNKTSYLPTKIAAGGDSGAAVFDRCGTSIGPSVRLEGVLWGGPQDGSFYYFSPLNAVEDELGELIVIYGSEPP